jgi:hypothetical protein
MARQAITPYSDFGFRMNFQLSTSEHDMYIHEVPPPKAYICTCWLLGYEVIPKGGLW